MDWDIDGAFGKSDEIEMTELEKLKSYMAGQYTILNAYQHVVFDIVSNISCESGHIWELLDEEVQDELLGVWLDIVNSQLERFDIN